MLKFNVKTILAGIVLLFLGLATPAAQAGILVTDGRNIDPGATGEDDTAKAKRAEAEARNSEDNTNEGDGTEELCPPTKMTQREAEIYVLVAAILNSPVVHVEDNTTPDPEALTTLNNVVDSLGDAEGGCAATPVGSLGSLAVALLLRRRRKRR